MDIKTLEALEKLVNLREKGLITSEEFDIQKQKLLNKYHKTTKTLTESNDKQENKEYHGYIDEIKEILKLSSVIFIFTLLYIITAKYIN